MGPSSRPEHHLNLGYLPQPALSQSRSGSSTAATSPIEPPSSSSVRYPLSSSAGLGSMSGATAGVRGGAGSPSHEFGSGRLFSKRAREIQAQEGLTPQVWGPPTSGNSTPLRETIPESPNGDSFPDFNQPAPEATNNVTAQNATRRTRAGTLPSRFSPAGTNNGLLTPSALLPRTSRPTPSASPFKPGSTTPVEPPGLAPGTALAAKSLLSRLRAGSMPQRGSFLPSTTNPFGPSLFSTSWSNSRDRTNTLASIRSSDDPSSPAQSSFSRDSLADTDVRTLDYLGLVDTPQQTRPTMGLSGIDLLLEQQGISNMADLASLTKNANRFRSYSVNAKEKYADEEDELNYGGSYGGYSGTLTPSESNAYAIHEAVRQHNLEVQAFANFATASRPRARTAGILDTPSTRLMRNYLPTASRLDNSISAADLSLAEEAEYSGLSDAVQSLQLNGKKHIDSVVDDNNLEGPTRALWLGNIPSSTTVSSLNVIFSNFGNIESTRVLTHKNCGFVNFESVENAVNAKSQLNGKEIFPGAGPVRIGYAKVPSATGTPNNNGIFPSPSPDPMASGQTDASAPSRGNSVKHLQQPNGSSDDTASMPLVTPQLPDIRGDIIRIVKDLGASDEEQMRIATSVDEAIQHDHYEAEIPPIPEPSHNRMYDAPRLREIRKRIDNSANPAAETEGIALDMLPEIAELSSDYLGNTVVQKLFEFCSEPVKEAMLEQIAPHLAEIGVHKNGTWAAQKIIDTAKTPALMTMIVNSLRPYAVALFLDQFGNYVVQGCLRFQYPLNNFVFEVMLSRLWDLAQGRFGARAMRACLESHHATKDQQRMIAAAIALHSVQLATNANGALLLTWFLDTCTFPRRRTVLAPRLVPHLIHLCTHKVAYLTVLKIINQRNEPEARDLILQALFFSPNDQVLEDILSDQSCGATLIFKVLTTPFFDEKIRPEVVQNIRNVLHRMKAQPQQGYKRLMDEVGLSRSGAPGPREAHTSDNSRPGSKQSAMNGTMNQSGMDGQMNRQFYPSMAQPAFDPTMNLQRAGSMDAKTFEQQYPLSVNVNVNGLTTPVYSPNSNMPNMPNMPMPPALTPQQLQYQQAVLASAAAAAARPPQPFYAPPMNVNVNGYPSPAPSMDAFRNVATSPVAGPGLSASPMQGSPMMPQGAFPPQPTYSPMSPMGGMQMFGYPQVQYLPQGQQAGVGRRGRVG